MPNLKRSGQKYITYCETRIATIFDRKLDIVPMAEICDIYARKVCVPEEGVTL